MPYAFFFCSPLVVLVESQVEAVQLSPTGLRVLVGEAKRVRAGVVPQKNDRLPGITFVQFTI